MKNYSYVGISFIILLFGIWAVPKIVDRMSGSDLAYIERTNEAGEVEYAKVPDFNFTSHRGATIDNNSYKGKVYIAEFFFTTCPSICPIMNQNMVKVQNEFYGNPNL
ncbi:MAG: SCO family protein, partial [Flavobacteriaceae bacterium]|nr:SCO family protein [Flavobacteriaceae bacterium]